MAERIRVLIADDHPVVRAGLANILDAEDDIEVVGEARDGPEAVSKALQLTPDIVIMDIFMPGCTGLEALVSIKSSLPGTRVFLLTISEKEEDLLEALRLGAEGYLLKSSTIDEMVHAVRVIAGGDVMLTPHMATLLVAEFRGGRKAADGEATLSTREAEVLELVGEGLTSTEIGDRLFVGESTIRTHLRRVMDKLHLRNRAEVVAYAVRLRLASNGR